MVSVDCGLELNKDYLRSIIAWMYLTFVEGKTKPTDHWILLQEHPEIEAELSTIDLTKH